MRKASNDSRVIVCSETLSLANLEEFQKAQGRQKGRQGDLIHLKEVGGKTPPECYEIPWSSSPFVSSLSFLGHSEKPLKLRHVITQASLRDLQGAQVMPRGGVRGAKGASKTWGRTVNVL